MEKNIIKISYNHQVYEASVSRSVGIDRLYLKLDIERIDYDKLFEHETDPNITLSRTVKATDVIPVKGNTNISDIKIKLDDYNTVYHLCRNHTTLGGSSVVTSTLKIFTIPEFEALGNIDNTPLSDIKNRVSDCLKLLESYGIVVADTHITEIEINKNIISDYPLLSYLKPLVPALKPKMVTECTSLYFAMTSQEDVGLLELKKAWENSSVKIYDKISVIKRNKKIPVQCTKHLIRTEFLLKRGWDLNYYLKNDNILTIEQDDLEKTYLELIKAKILNPILEHDEHRHNKLKELINECLNKRNMANALYIDIISYENASYFDFLCLNHEELLDISSSCIKDANKRKYIKKRITNEFKQDKYRCYDSFNRRIRDKYFHHLQNDDTSMIIAGLTGLETPSC